MVEAAQPYSLDPLQRQWDHLKCMSWLEQYCYQAALKPHQQSQNAAWPLSPAMGGHSEIEHVVLTNLLADCAEDLGSNEVGEIKEPHTVVELELAPINRLYLYLKGGNGEIHLGPRCLAGTRKTTTNATPARATSQLSLSANLNLRLLTCSVPAHTMSQTSSALLNASSTIFSDTNSTRIEVTEGPEKK